ncbi:MAG: polysaccharide biosynthesis/export family protein [Sandaracinaceae bacterium]|nr:polysaccharide biosynthesis/export family protein [Sandaracinaceae bacterium]
MIATLACWLGAGIGSAQQAPAAASSATPATGATGADSSGVTPFGASLFAGNFSGQREDGLNEDYQVLPGDRVMVNVWGSATINDVFVVDAQGNIFLPGVGPVRLAGVPARELTQAVRREVAQRFRSGFEVYTNLLTASPVAVFVTGAVPRPGRYAGIASDSVLVYLDQAGGIDARSGSYRNVQLLRAGQVVAELDLYDFLLRGTLPTPQLRDGDTLLVGRRGPSVEVQLPTGERIGVELREDEPAAELVQQVVRPSARVNEVSVRGVRNGDHIARTLGVEALGSFELMDGDVVTFREEGQAAHVLIRLEGEFQGPSTLSVPRGARLLDVLNHVPVNPEVANVGAVHLRRASIAREQHRTIQESLDRLQRSAMLALSESAGESEIRVREAEMMNAFIERARNIQPLGRVVTRSLDAQLNVMLEEGDVVVIPTRTNVIRVGGEVQFSQALMYRPGLRVRDYVSMAGGFSNRAETRTVIVLRPSAEVFIADNNTRIQPGDEILVPPRIDRKVFQHAIEISQIMYQIAIAASVLLRV